MGVSLSPPTSPGTALSSPMLVAHAVPPSLARTSGIPSVASTGAPAIASVPSWVNLSRNGSAPSPPAGYAESLAYDPPDGATVLFGGCLATLCPSNQTWVFAGGSWRNVTNPSDAPPARDYAGMDFDARMGGVLLFGGSTASGPLNDTWLFQGGVWTNLTYVGTAPSPRYGASLAYDPDPEENGSVLYGGCVPAFLGVSCYNDTWVWRAWSGWVPLSPSVTPPAVGFAAMAYDPLLGATVLFGGCAGVLCLGESNQTWELYAGEWWPVLPATFPSSRSGSSMAYDPVGERLLLFGGLNFTTGTLNDTWSYTGAGWALVASASGPSARDDFGLSYDPYGSTLLLFGGSDANGTDQNDTWVFAAPPALTLSASASTVEVGATVNYSATVTGGVPPYSVLLRLGDGATAETIGNGPVISFSASYGAAGDYLAVANLSDTVGLAATASASVTVTVGLGVTAEAAPAAGDVGIPVSFQATATAPGTPPIQYTWTFGDGSTGSGAAASHAYASAGTYAVNVAATDAVGSTAAATVSVTIAAPPSVSVSFLPRAPNTSSAVVWGATVTGGNGPYTFSWNFGDGGRSTLPSPVHEFPKAGQYSVTLWLNDSLGAPAQASAVVTVTNAPAGPGPSGTLGSAPTWFWAGAGGLVAVAVVGTALLLRRRHSR